LRNLHANPQDLQEFLDLPKSVKFKKVKSIRKQVKIRNILSIIEKN
jgi:hypothetical protein